MKYMVISDIHGSGYYLEKAMKIFREDKYEKLIILGDILYHGPRNDLPLEYNCKKVFEILNQIKEKIICVKGNCDSEVDQMVLEFKIEDEYSFSLNKRTVFLTHGHIFNYDHVPTYLKENDILFYGHFHVPFILEKYNILFCNPGSISLPKQNSKNSFICLTDEKIEIFDLEKNKIEEVLL